MANIHVDPTLPRQPPEDPNHTCYDCGGEPHAFMVSDAVWRSAWPTYIQDRSTRYDRVCALYGVSNLKEIPPDCRQGAGRQVMALLCPACLEVRLMRSLRISDITRVAFNRPLFSGFRAAGLDITVPPLTWPANGERTCFLCGKLASYSIGAASIGGQRLCLECAEATLGRAPVLGEIPLFPCYLLGYAIAMRGGNS